MAIKERTTKLPFPAKLGFGAAELSSSLTWTMISVVFLFFLTDVVGLDPAFAGFVLMVGTLWDAVTDPAIGVISDRMKSKWGRRRPFILAVAVPYGLITWLLFTDFGLGDFSTRVYFILAIVFYYTSATLLEVPYTSLAAEMTPDYDERASLIGFRAAFSQLASIIGAAVPWVLVAFFKDQFGSEQAGWSITAAIFGVICIPFILWTWRATRGYELHPENVTVRLRDIFQGPLKNRSFRYTIAMLASGNVGLSLAGAVMVYFMKYYMQFDETQESLAFLFLFACTLLWIPVINKVTFKYGKRESLMAFIGIWAVIQAGGAILLQPSMIIPFYIMMVLSSAGVISISLTGLSMIPDVIEVDEFKTGQRREGIYVGVNMFTRKFSTALMLWIVGIVLSKVGYVPDQAQTETALFGIRLMYAEGTAFFLFLCIILAYLMPMTRQRHQALREAILAKKEGKKPDIELIKPLL